MIGTGEVWKNPFGDGRVGRLILDSITQTDSCLIVVDDGSSDHLTAEVAGDPGSTARRSAQCIRAGS